MSETIKLNQPERRSPDPVETEASLAVENPLAESIIPTTTPSTDSLSVVDESTQLKQPESASLPTSISIPEAQPLRYTPNLFKARRIPGSDQCFATVNYRQSQLRQAA